MKELSQRAHNFLNKYLREPSITTGNEIVEALQNNGAPVFAPVIEFKKKYTCPLCAIKIRQ